MGQLIQFVQHHWELCLLFLAILLLVGINEFITQRTLPQMLSPQLAVEKMNHQDATLFDIRDQGSFQAGHVIHSIRIESSDFKESRMEKYKTKPIVLVCTKGIQAQSLASSLKKQGYTQVMVLEGGIEAWRTAGLPLVKGNK